MSLKTTKPLTELIRFVLPVGILAVGVLAFAAITSQQEPPPQVERKVSVPLVEVVPIKEHKGPMNIRVDGLVVPHREISLSAEVAGRITMIAEECQAGKYVTAGTLLVEIDPRTYQLEVDRLSEEVAQADATLQELDVSVGNAKTLISLAEEEVALRQRELDRQVALRQKNATSESTVDEFRRMELSSRNNLAMLTNELRTLEASRTRLASARGLAAAKLKQASLDLEKSQVRAPIDGVIVSESVEENNFVQPGTSLLLIEDVNAVEVRCSLKMEELDWIWQQAPADSARNSAAIGGDYHLPPTPVTVTYGLGGRQYSWTGTLWRYEGIGLDERTRTVPCRVLVEEPRQVQTELASSRELKGGPRALVRGMFVQVTIHARPDTQLLCVPEIAVRPGNVVWCVRDGKLHQVSLRDMTLVGDQVLVPLEYNRLAHGDQVVVTPLPVAVEGMSVQLADPPAESTDGDAE